MLNSQLNLIHNAINIVKIKSAPVVQELFLVRLGIPLSPLRSKPQNIAGKRLQWGSYDKDEGIKFKILGKGLILLGD